MHSHPTLHGVLSRKRRAPIDLYMFYLFLKEKGYSDMLDFWLDVQEHENLCRAYLTNIHKSGKSIKEEWPQYYDYTSRRGSIYGVVRPRAPELAVTSRPVSAAPSRRASHELRPPLSTINSGTTHNRSLSIPFSLYSNTFSLYPSSFSIARLSRTFSRRSIPHAPVIIPRSGNATITRTDLIASAEHIFVRYLAPGAESPIFLPEDLHILSLPISAIELPSPTSPEYDVEAAALAQVPDMFHAQKEHVFKVMEREMFPRFLREKKLHNITRGSAFLRLGLSLLYFLVGFTIAFALIFLDVQPKSVRFYNFIPFTVGAFLYLSFIYKLDPILVLIAQSEFSKSHYITVRDPYVKASLIRRSLYVCSITVVLSSGLTLVLWAVPGYRLTRP